MLVFVCSFGPLFMRLRRFPHLKGASAEGALPPQKINEGPTGPECWAPKVVGSHLGSQGTLRKASPKKLVCDIRILMLVFGHCGAHARAARSPFRISGIWSQGRSRNFAKMASQHKDTALSEIVASFPQPQDRVR